MSAHGRADVIVVGGGFYGLRLALFAREVLGADRVVVFEAEESTMTRASYVNQARVHNGYHYPRSVLTAYRSRVSSAEFEAEYAPAIVSDFTHYYGVAARLSKINARQFEAFCDRIGAPWAPASPEISSLFSPALVERVWKVREAAFDSRILRELLLGRIRDAGGVEIRTASPVARVVEGPGVVLEDGRRWDAPLVMSAVYANLNALHRASGLPTIALQQEVVEMPLVRLPERFRDFGITVMDGPFFSLMPFPSRGLHSLSHVRYTPRERWTDDDSAGHPRAIPRPSSLLGMRSAFTEMRLDVQRYIPALSQLDYAGSLREIKTVLTASAASDSRPIFVRSDFGMAGYTCVLGGKIDNIDDVLAELGSTLPVPRATER